jgi:anti-sigma-K factor RskA
MNNDKAREFFSSYYEGTLDFGLTQSFEQKLRTDSALMADYAAFVETMNELDAMRYEEIEVPVTLSDRIATRIEQVAEKSSSRAIPAWMVWFRGLSMGAAAAAVIGVAFVTLNNNFKADGPVATGNVISTDINVDHLNFRYNDGKVLVQYKPSSARTVVISSGVTGKEMQRFTLDGKSLDSPLENTLTETSLFDVQVLGETQKATIAIPGIERSNEKSGSGDVKKFAAALAGFYRVPVVLEISNLSKPVTWEFNVSDVREAASKAVTPEGYSVDQRTSGMIVIMDR